MYQVLKEKGALANVIIENTETKASIIIGKITPSIVDILKSEGYSFEEEGLTVSDAWKIRVSTETGKLLASKAMTMRKPIRDQRKIKPEGVVDTPKKSNKEIDAMDVLLGLASYS